MARDVWTESFLLHDGWNSRIASGGRRGMTGRHGKLHPLGDYRWKRHCSATTWSVLQGAPLGVALAKFNKTSHCGRALISGLDRGVRQTGSVHSSSFSAHTARILTSCVYRLKTWQHRHFCTELRQSELHQVIHWETLKASLVCDQNALWDGGGAG